MNRYLFLLSLLSLYKTVQGTAPEEPTTSATETPTTTTAPTHTPSLFTVLTHGLDTTTQSGPPALTAKEQERLEALKDANEKARIARLEKVLQTYMPVVGKGQFAHAPLDAGAIDEDIRKQRKIFKADKELSGAGAEMEIGEVLAGVVSGIRKQGRSSKQPDLYLKIADADTGESKP